jgi:hypothetical protein
VLRSRRGLIRVFLATTFAFGSLSIAARAEAAPAKKSAKKGSKKKEPKDAKGEKEFKERYASLLKTQEKGPIKIEMAVKDDPNEIPADIQQGMVLVAHTRRGIYTPPLLSSEDILTVINEHMATIRKCYKQQLEEDPEWSDEVILDLSVKKTGRISEVTLSPSRLQRYLIGKCLLAEVPKWKFPEFTGELEDGVTQEVVNASFPFSFSSRSR